MTSSMQRLSALVLVAVFALASIVAIPMPVEAAAGINDLVKCPDFSAVYYIGDDGNRYTFPNDKIFFTWYEDFAEVKNISCERLGDIKLMGNVPYAAGTRLVKIPSVARVYAVESDGVLRPIASEEQASKLFGEDWAQRVDDLSEAFFPRYTLGSELDAGEVPEGTIIEDEDGLLFRYNYDGQLEEIDDLLTDQQKRVLKQYSHGIEKFEKRLDHLVERVGKLERRIEKRLAHLRRLKAIHFYENEVDVVEIEIPELEDEFAELKGDDILNVIDDTLDKTLDDFTDTLDDAVDELTKIIEENALDIDMTTRSFEFEPSVIEAHPGQLVRVKSISNDGTHTFSIDAIQLSKDIVVGEKIEFFAPTEPGEYEYYCGVGDHRAQGMVGTLIVK